MSKIRKLLSVVLVVTMFATGLFVGTVTATAETMFSTVNTYDEENTSYRYAVSGNETCSYITVDGVEDDWYCFATWNASVQQDTTKTGSTQNAVQFVKAAKIGYDWPAAVRIYDNNSDNVPHFKAKSNTTYEIKFKYNAVTAPDREILLQVRYTNTSNIHETAVNDDDKVVASKIVSITEATSGWTEAAAQFTTGDTVGYLNLTLCSATNTDAKNVNVWIDDVTLNECKNITAHGYNGSNKNITVTANTTLSDIALPSREGYALEGVYADSAYSNKLSSADKLASFDHIYYNWVKTAEKTYYCGFESYTEQIESLSMDKNVAEIVSGTAYIGDKALKLTLGEKGLTAFELRDTTPFDIVSGKEYEITFAYKASASASFHAGLALAGDITGTAESKVFVNGTASDEWQTATVSLTPDKSTKDGYALVMLVQTDAANEIYVDDFKVTYLSAGTSTLDEINFGFTGETFPELKVFDEAVDGLPETDNGEEENPEETAPTVWDGTVAESFAGGSGTEADPYLIATAEQLALAITQSGTTKQTNAETGEEETVNETYFGSYYKLTKDILLNDPNAIDWKNATEAQEGLRTWYDYQENFAGHIDGDGHVVYGLYHYTKGTIDSSIAYATYGKKGAGLIPLVNTDDTVTITNMGIDCAYVRHQYSAGAFIGSGATSTITNCFVGENVKVEGKDIGAFIGRNYAKKFTLQNCYSLATVYGNSKSLYGLVGQFYQTTATMKNCYNANGPLTSYSSPNYSTVYKFYDSYETQTSGTNTKYPARDTKTNVYTITADKMQGLDVLTDETKMPYLALNTDGSANTSFTATKTYPVLTLWAPEPEVEEGEEEETTYDIWDGSKTEPKDTNEDGIYEITNGAELAYIIANHGTMITGTETVIDETTGEETTTDIKTEACRFVLTNDIYLNDITKINWLTGDIAIGYTPNVWFGYKTNFAGSIDGNGHTVFGIYSDSLALNKKSWGIYGVGFIPWVHWEDTVNLTNLGIDYAYIHGECGAAAFVGCAGTSNSGTTDSYSNINIEKCYAGKNVMVLGYNAGVFRGAGKYSNTYITDCYSLATTQSDTDNNNSFIGMIDSNCPVTIDGCFNANGTLCSGSAGVTITNSYQTVAGKQSAVTSLANMKGSDVLTSTSKMPLLNRTVFKAGSQTFEEYDFYVYLPQGTSFEEEIKVEFYNDLFIKLDKETVLSNGVMQKGAYVKFAAEPDESKITVPAELKQFVRYGLKEELLLTNPYYGVKMDFIDREIAGGDSVKYAFITDIHYVGGEDIPRTLATIKQIENLVEYVNNTDEIDFVAIGGDTIQGTQNKTTSLGYFKKAFTPFLSCNKPVVIVPGNHDDNSYAYNTKTFDGSWLITDKDWNDKIIDIYVKLARVEPDTPSKQNFR